MLRKGTCPTTGKKHVQESVCFRKRTSLATLKGIDATGHFEAARGSVQESRDSVERMVISVSLELSLTSSGQKAAKQGKETVRRSCGEG